MPTVFQTNAQFRKNVTSDHHILLCNFSETLSNNMYFTQHPQICSVTSVCNIKK